MGVDPKLLGRENPPDGLAGLVTGATVVVSAGGTAAGAVAAGAVAAGELLGTFGFVVGIGAVQEGEDETCEAGATWGEVPGVSDWLAC